MLHLLFYNVTASVMSPSKPTSATAAAATHHHKSSAHHQSSLLFCKHYSSATLDLLILLLVLFSGAFLLCSYFSYLYNSLSLLLSPLLSSIPPVSLPFLSYIMGCTFFFATTLISMLCCGTRSQKCHRPGCKGLKKALEFDLQLQMEDSVKKGSLEIDKLPWKGGSQGNPDYECLRAELRKMAPPNGRALLLFRARCGCPVAKLEGWGPKRGRRHKKALANVAPNKDHRQ